MRNVYANNIITSTSIANLVLPGQVVNDIIPLNGSRFNHTVPHTNASYYLYVTSSANPWPNITLFWIAWVEITYTN